MVSSYCLNAFHSCRSFLIFHGLKPPSAGRVGRTLARLSCPALQLGPPSKRQSRLSLKGFQNSAPTLGGFIFRVGPVLRSKDRTSGFWAGNPHSYQTLWKVRTMTIIMYLWPTSLSIFFFFINQSNILSPNTDNRDSLWLTSLHSKKEPASVTLSSKIAYPVFNTPKRLLPTALWSSIFLNSLLRGTLSKACKEVQVNYVPGFTFTYYFINFFKNNMT